MTDRVFKPEILKDNISSSPADGFRQSLERADVYLPVETEVSPVSEESRVVVYNDPRSAGADRFRLARARLSNLQATKKLKNLLITSPLPEDGKSTVAVNLATVLSESGKAPVLLLEADVYRPGLVKRLGLKPWPGLTECYKRGSDPMLAIRRIDPLGFYLLPGGQPVDDENSFLLQSNFFTQLIKGLSSSSFGWVLIDSPPTTPIADILALSALADATLLVVRAGKTPREAIEESVKNLGRDRIIGIILNSVEGLDRVYSKYYGYAKPEPRTKLTPPKLIMGLGLDKHAG
ncbi:MAG: CpsD/CapB family tyrosine-protein kinase [Terriglobia bacterium]